MRSCLLNRKRVYQNPCSFLLVTYLKSTRFILNIPKYLQSYFFSFSNYTHEFEKKIPLNLEIISDLQKKKCRDHAECQTPSPASPMLSSYATVFVICGLGWQVPPSRQDVNSESRSIYLGDHRLLSKHLAQGIMCSTFLKFRLWWLWWTII